MSPYGQACMAYETAKKRHQELMDKVEEELK
jgi:hypothetical protein